MAKRKTTETETEHTRTTIEFDSRELAELEGFIEMRQKWLKTTPIYNSANFEDREEHTTVLNRMHARVARARAQLVVDTDGREAAPVEFARKGGSARKASFRAIPEE